MIRDCAEQDAVRIAEIYNYYVQNTVASFEEGSITAEMMMERMMNITRTYPWLVFEAVYNFDKVFAQGRLCDRGLEKAF